MATNQEGMMEFDQTARTQNEFAKKQVSEALQISLDI
jgi:hypothetical protein